MGQWWTTYLLLRDEQVGCSGETSGVVQFSRGQVEDIANTVGVVACERRLVQRQAHGGEGESLGFGRGIFVGRIS